MDYKYLEVLAEKEDALMSKMKLSMSEKSVTLAWEPKVEFRDYTFTIYGEPQSCSTSQDNTCEFVFADLIVSGRRLKSTNVGDLFEVQIMGSYGATLVNYETKA